MLVYMISNAVGLLFGLLYPAYASFLAVKNKDVRGYVQWMMYWIVFAFYSAVALFTDTLLGPWFPLYYEMKICFLLWLMAPQTGGAGFLYRRFLHSKLVKYEPEIDKCLLNVQSQTSAFIFQWANRIISTVIQSVSETVRRGAIQAAKHEVLSQHLRSLSLDTFQHTESFNSTTSLVVSRSLGVTPSSDLDIEEFLGAAGGNTNAHATGSTLEDEIENTSSEGMGIMEVEQEPTPKKPRTRRGRKEQVDVLNSDNRVHDTRRKRTGKGKKDRSYSSHLEFE